MTAYAQKPETLTNDSYWASIFVNGVDIAYSTSYGDHGGVRTPPILVRKGDSIVIGGAFMLKDGNSKQLRFHKFNH